MKPARLIVLLLGLFAGAGAFYLMMSKPPPAKPVAEVKALPVTVDVLVAAKDIAMGNSVKASDLRWQAWAHDFIPPEATRRSEFPQADSEFVGMMSRTALIAGQPISRKLFINAGGYMSAILPAGKRAVAVSIDNRGTSSAGNFIFPNDRVDVIHVGSSEADGRSNGGESSLAETILRNIRVLAIGANVDRKEGTQTSAGVTATLEVSPAQAELISNAQKAGQLVLVLRSSSDVDADQPERNVLTIVRFGFSQTSSKQ